MIITMLILGWIGGVSTLGYEYYDKVRRQAEQDEIICPAPQMFDCIVETYTWRKTTRPCTLEEREEHFKRLCHDTDSK